MPIENQEQAVRVSVKTAEISFRVLKNLIETMLANRERTQHGEQKLSKLNLQNRQLESVEINDSDLKALRRELNKYSVDFSIFKERNSENHTVYFKGQDVDRVYQGLSNCIKNFDKESLKKPVKEKLKDAEQRSAQRESERPKQKEERSADRGKEVR